MNIQPMVRQEEDTRNSRGDRVEVLADHVNGLTLEDPFTVTLSSVDTAEVNALPDGQVHHVICAHRINDARYLNKFFEAVNVKLPEGGCFIGNAETSEQRKHRILNKYPRWFAWPYYTLDFVFKRAFPKLSLTKKFYFALTKGRNRVLSTAEVLGRLACCGFELIQYEEVDNRLRFVGRKVRPPAYDMHPTYGPLIKMKRMGQDGKEIHLFKLRTMHPYAEYLQAHVCVQNGLAESGKFKDDFRITTWGRFMRRNWIDELPMLYNWIKRDLKLFGVRPLTAQYLGLYPEELATRRLRHKPGLVPPFYVDLPQCFEEVLASEERYLKAYEQHPFKTDVRYFWKAVYNILFRRARSG